MADDTTIEIVGLKGILKNLLAMEGHISSKILMGNIGEFIKFKIQARSQEGVDVDLNPFKPYSGSYAAYRRKEGHPVDKVNLTFTGAMWNALTYKAGKQSVHVYFLNTPGPGSKGKKKVTNAAKAFFLNEDRRFFALNEQEVETIRNMVQEYISWASRA